MCPWFQLWKLPYKQYIFRLSRTHIHIKGEGMRSSGSGSNEDETLSGTSTRRHFGFEPNLRGLELEDVKGGIEVT